MPVSVCDRSPCVEFERALFELLTTDGNADSFDMIVVSRKQGPIRVFLKYCPFCGTRIDTDWIDAMRRSRQGKKR